MADNHLTPKQELFIRYYLQNFNATQAHIKAFGSKRSTGSTEGWKLLQKPYIQKEITRLKKQLLKKSYIDAKDILQEYIKIAFADIGDYIEVKNNIVTINDSDSFDTSLISEVSQDKFGIKICLHDKLKALDRLVKYLDLFPDDWKRKIEEEKLKILKGEDNQNTDRPILIDDVENIIDDAEKVDTDE